MPKKIEQLTDEQIARFPEFVEKWKTIGLCTDPADRPRAEAGIRQAYQSAGLEPPKRIVWCGSPLSQGLTRAIVFKLGEPDVPVWDSVRDSVGASVWDSVRDSVGASVRDSVWASVRDSVRDSVWDSVRDSVWDSVRDSVGASVRDSVRDSVWGSVRDSVWDSVWDSVGASVRDSVWDSVRDSVRDSVWASVRDSVRDSVRGSVRDGGFGQHDASWLAFYDYFALACSLSNETQKLAGMWELAQSANWWLPHAEICWVSERHRKVSLDGDQLHCDDGPAIEYPDGWQLWALDGVLVDEQIVMWPETQTIMQIDDEGNEEKRRLRIERFGVLRYVEESDSHVRDSRRNEIENTYEILVDTKHGQRLITHCPSTGRRYFLGVPEAVETCEQAQRAIWGVDCNIIGRT